MDTAILDRLTDAGLALLKEEAPEALTIERVCKVAGVSRATFYRRWKSINPVFVAMGERLMIEANPRAYRSRDLRGKLIESAHNIAVLLADGRVAALFRYAFSKASLDDDLRKMVQYLDRRRNEWTINCIRVAQADGQVRNDIRPDYIAHQLFGPIWHRTLLLQIPPDSAFIEAAVDTVFRSISLPDG